MGTMTDTYLTRAGFEKLKADLAALMKQKTQLSADIGEAREKGDLKENAEYHSAKEKMGEVMSRIGIIQDKLQGAKIIDDMQTPKDTVAIGMTVTLEDGDGETIEYTFVGEDESDPMEGRISVTSPLGSGLMGRKVKETVEVQLPAGPRSFKILKVARGV
ncbi:MAG: transcription elongation factor GreA [Elusimicrobiota bacterium]|nr:transcription elongation factor GreA [Elusimicrobiota bacterium]